MSSGYSEADSGPWHGVESDAMEEALKKRLAFAIRSTRERRGMTVHELADALHVASSTVYGWESGDKAPSLLALGPLCDALGVSADLFRVLPEEPPSPIEDYLVEAAVEGAREGVRRASGRTSR